MELALDPRTKILGFASIMALAFICKDILVIGLLAAVAAATSLFLSSEREFVRIGLKSMIPLLAVAFLLWSFTYKWSIFQQYGGYSGFEVGVFMALRLFLILLVSLNFVASVKPSELVKGLEAFRIPYRAAFLLSLTLRHVYTIADDYRAIKEAQMSRGLELDKGSLLKRIKNYVPVMTPLLVRSIEKAEELALAMELKNFSFKRRRAAGKLKLMDAAIIGAFAAAVALAVLHYWVGVL